MNESDPSRKKRLSAKAKVTAGVIGAVASVVGLQVNQEVDDTAVSTPHVEATDPASWIATPIASVIDKATGQEAIYQPGDTSPTSTGSKIPQGELAPLGWVSISPVPGHPDESVIKYGNEPNGETLPNVIIDQSPSELLMEQPPLYNPGVPKIDLGPTPGVSGNTPPKNTPSSEIVHHKIPNPVIDLNQPKH